MLDSGDLLPFFLILINALYIPIIIYSLLKLKKEGMNRNILVKFSITTLIFSLLLTYLLRDSVAYDKLIFLFLIILCSLYLFFSFIFFRKDNFSWSLITFFVTCLLISIALPLTIDYLQKDTNDGILKTNEDFNMYIENNVECAVYVVDVAWEYNHKLGDIIHEHKLAIYIINNGSKNIDKPLQINIDCSLNKKFTIAKPEGNLNLSYFHNTIKPWVFGNNYSVNIRWNDSYAGSTLEKNSHRWAIINCYTPDLLYCDEFDILDFTVLIDDEFNVKITKIPCYVETPSGNPKYWDVSIILKDINMHG